MAMQTSLFAAAEACLRSDRVDDKLQRAGRLREAFEAGQLSIAAPNEKPGLRDAGHPSRPELVPRPRLIDRLNAGLHRKLTLVSAPAGFGKTTLLGISKRGDIYVRSLLIHGARSVLLRCKHKTDPKSRWLQRLIERRGFNRACVALANKNARTLWALMAHGEDYRLAA